MKTVVFPSIDPPVSSELEAHWVVWVIHVDSSTDWYQYFTGGTLPFIGTVDPAEPDVAIDRSTNIQRADPFLARLQQARLPVPKILAPSSLSGLSGSAVDALVDATKSPTAFEITGELPPGVTFDPVAGRFGGTWPWEPDTWKVEITASNEAGDSSPFPVSLTLLPEGWSASGDAGWSFQSEVLGPSGAQKCLRSDLIDNSQSVTLTIAVQGPATFAFWAKVSTEEHFDLLQVRIAEDPTIIHSVSGEQDWARYEVSVPSGNQAVQIEYAKDNISSGGQDAVWLDGFDYPGAPMLFQPTPEFKVTEIGWRDSELHLEWTATAGATYRVERLNLSAASGWVPVPDTQVTATGSTAEMDIVSPSGQTGIYRIVRQ